MADGGSARKIVSSARQ